MNLTYIFFIALPLALTLISAAILDIKHREVRAYTWVPAIILGIAGYIAGAYEITLQFGVFMLINGIACLFILAASSTNQYLYVTKKTGRIYFGFADALCIILICALKPVSFNVPTLLPLLLISGLVLCAGFLIPCIQKRWVENTPFIVPLAFGGIGCLLV